MTSVSELRSEEWEPMETAPLMARLSRFVEEHCALTVSWSRSIGAWVIGLATEPNECDRILPWRPISWAPVPGALE